MTPYNIRNLSIILGMALLLTSCALFNSEPYPQKIGTPEQTSPADQKEIKQNETAIQKSPVTQKTQPLTLHDAKKEVYKRYPNTQSIVYDATNSKVNIVLYAPYPSSQAYKDKIRDELALLFDYPISIDFSAYKAEPPIRLPDADEVNE